MGGYKKVVESRIGNSSPAKSSNALSVTGKNTLEVQQEQKIVGRRKTAHKEQPFAQTLFPIGSLQSQPSLSHIIICSVCSAHSTTLKMEITYFSENLVPMYQTTHNHILEDFKGNECLQDVEWIKLN